MRELVLPWSLGSLLLLGVAAIGWLELLDVPALEPHHDPWKGNSSINHQLENKARWAIPNYSRIWYARNLLWDTRGGYSSGGDFVMDGNQLRTGQLNSFGGDFVMGYNRPILSEGLPLGHTSYQLRPWDSVLCKMDSDQDGYLNGQELGDPCCIWGDTNGRSRSQLAWTWGLSRPGGDRGSVPGPQIQKLINQINCTQVSEVGIYPDHDEAFDSYFFADENDSPPSWGADLVRICFICVHQLAVGWWCVACKLTSNPCGRLGYCGMAAVFVLALLYLDLLSAFTHQYLDSCWWGHPMIGPQCKGTQAHHNHPRTQSLEPMMHWWGNPIATLPATVLILLYGYLGSAFSVRYPRWFEFLLLWVAALAPCTYIFHQAAHTPSEDRAAAFNLLQSVGLALSPQHHKEHHRFPNGTWSVFLGWLDFIPNFMSQFPAWWEGRNGASEAGLYVLNYAQRSLVCVWVMLLLPWYGWLVYFTFRKHTKSDTADLTHVGSQVNKVKTP